MKKIISTCIALMVSAACSISAFAMEVPTNTTIQDLNGVRQYIKIYTVAPDTDPQSLIDDVFEYDGYTYTYSSMTKEEQSYSEKEHHTETVTADTEKSDLSVVLKALSPSIEYDDGEFRGTLYLDHSTISTVASGYWKGRLLLEQAKQDHDRCNDYKDAAIASFCATNVTERFDHLPENADEDAAPQLSPPQWLSAIELLRYPDREVFRVDRRMVFQTIYQKLTQQVEEVQSDRIQIHNERYRLTKKDVRSNLERCLDMVKARFPDKEPLIQEMIRSIR